jgi:hypothetical protein
MSIEETASIVWEEPKPARKRGTDEPLVPEKSMKKYESYVQGLKAQPNRWAVFKKGVSPTYSTRLKAAYPGVETTCRRVWCDDGKQRFDVYARWVG